MNLLQQDRATRCSNFLRQVTSFPRYLFLLMLECLTHLSYTCKAFATLLDGDISACPWAYRDKHVASRATFAMATFFVVCFPTYTSEYSHLFTSTLIMNHICCSCLCDIAALNFNCVTCMHTHTEVCYTFWFPVQSTVHCHIHIFQSPPCLLLPVMATNLSKI